jgi:hypothetical protein
MARCDLPDRQFESFSLRQPTSAPVGLCGAIALEILLFCRDFHAREFEGLGQAALKRAWRMDFSPDPLYQLQRYRPRFRNLINASSVVVSKPSPSGESVRFPTRNSRFRNLPPRLGIPRFGEASFLGVKFL